MIDLFLSHTRVDKPFAHFLGERLRADGISVWIDEFEMQIGDSLVEKIGLAIKEAAYLAVVLSPESVESSWVPREVEIALSEEFEGSSVKVLPLLLRSCEIPAFLRGKLYADFSDDFEEPYRRLLSRLLPKVPARSRESIIEFVDTFRLATSDIEARLLAYITVEGILHNDSSEEFMVIVKSAILGAMTGHLLTVTPKEYYLNFGENDDEVSVKQGLIQAAKAIIEKNGLTAGTLIFVQESDELAEGFNALLYKAWQISVTTPNLGSRIGHFRVSAILPDGWYKYATLRPSYADITDRIEARVTADCQQYTGMLRELSIGRDLAAKAICRVGEEEFGLHLELLDWRRTDNSLLDPTA